MNDSALSCINKGPYYNHFIHLLSFGSIWIIASIIGFFHYENLAIMFLFVGISLFNPLYNMVRKALSLCPMSSDDPLKMIITCMTIGVPVGIILGFLPFLENINTFFHVFGILFGAVFLMVAYVYKLKGYLILSLILILGELGLIYFYDDFTVGGFFAGVILIACAVIVRVWSTFSPHVIRFSLNRQKTSIGNQLN